MSIMRISFPAVAAIAAMLAFGSTAQAQSGEGRGYGGPLTVGPNFSNGGVYGPPVYGPGVKKPSAKTKPKTAKRPKPPTPNSASKPSEEAKKPDVTDENTKATDGTTAAKGATCTRFDATTGKSIQLPCP